MSRRVKQPPRGLGAAAVLIVAMLGGPARGQAPKTFAAVSIKLYKRGDRSVVPGQPFVTDPAGLHVLDRPLSEMILLAYGLYDFQLRGGAFWTHRLGYNLDAATSKPSTHGQLLAMLQGALAVRFGLQLTRTEEPIRVFGLFLSQDGPRLRPLPIGENPEMQMPPVGLASYRFTTTRDLVDNLNRAALRGSEGLARPLIDETGLTGRYDIHFQMPVTSLGKIHGHLTWQVNWRHLPEALKPLGLELKPEVVRLPIFTIKYAHEPKLN